MDLFDLLALLGALAVFLYGMDLLSRSLEKQAGPRLQRMLAGLTEDPLRGFALGLAVTAAIQSSGSATVMVVGFVNSGLLGLHGAVGVILGSNVGTTLTAWILSLAGVQGTGFWARLAQPACLGAALAFAGAVLYLFCRGERRRGAGAILLGLALMLGGMGSLCAALRPLAALPAFSVLTAFLSHPLAGVLAGALVSALLQSSAAAVGVLQALALTGAVPWAAAVPVLMGVNIGSCVPALLAGIGANANARRAAAVHLYFNLLGAALFLALFYGVGTAFHTGAPATAAGVALAHTGFNALAAAVLLPAGRLLEKLAVLTVPDEAGPERFQLLDNRLLNQPALAVRRAGDVAGAMAARARKSLVQAMSLTRRWDDALAAEVSAAEERIDGWEDALGTYLLLLGRQSLSIGESRTVSALLHTVNDFERIGDHAVNLCACAQEIREKEAVFSAQARRDLDVLERAVQDILTRTVTAFSLIAGAPAALARASAKEAAAGVEPLEQTIDELVRAIKARHVLRLRQGQCSLELGFILTDLVNHYERVADHCSNVAAAALSADTDTFDTHDYLERMRTAGGDYPARLAACRKQYALDTTGGTL